MIKSWILISSLSHISSYQIYVRVVKISVQNHLERNYYLGEFQQVFKSRKSFLSQLLQYQDKILSTTEYWKWLGMWLSISRFCQGIWLGLSRYTKSQDIVIYGRIIICLNDFLKDRSNQVLANEILSHKYHIKSGVLQGTVLGLLSFLMNINSSNNKDLESFLSSCADDSKL